MTPIFARESHDEGDLRPVRPVRGGGARSGEPRRLPGDRPDRLEANHSSGWGLDDGPPNVRLRLDVGPAPRGGDGNTVGATGGADNQTSGASFRIVVDVGDWEKTLGTMEKWGVKLTPAEHDTLRTYLVTHLGQRKR